MNLDELQQQLADLVNSGDPVFAQVADNVQQIVEAAKAGQLSGVELKEILEDTQRQLSIINEMSQLEYKEKLNTVLNGLITIATAV
jgi:ABC-type transporter Mla subunit MlaD